jgi:hypothetical protein
MPKPLGPPHGLFHQPVEVTHHGLLQHLMKAILVPGGNWFYV